MHAATHKAKNLTKHLIPTSRRLKNSYFKLTKLGRKIKPSRLIIITKRNPYTSVGVAALSLSALLGCAYWMLNKR